MKSVFNMFMVFIVMYIILCSGLLDFLADDLTYKIAIGSVCLLFFLFAVLVGTPFTKPLVKMKGVKHDEEKHLD